MIHKNQNYNAETKESEVEYYWFDSNFTRHGGFPSCFDASEALQKFADELEKSINEVL